MFDTKIESFRAFIWNYYTEHKRSMPWREDITPYNIVISEIMLQQTQVPRVMQKYPEFLEKFPDFKTLAQASLGEVLEQWQGMGYNRRGKYLHEIAKKVITEYNGKLPNDPVILQIFPGLGHATASSIVTFAFNKPISFIETNIRRVFIHHFFADAEGIHDKEIMPIVKKALDKTNPREWYYALMDYGTFLAKQVPNPNRKSKHYAKQSKFEGSTRQLRGEILRIVLKQKIVTEDMIRDLPIAEGHNIISILESLEQEGFLLKDEKERYTVK